ncbi:hypothetical protein [Caldinitratiruptor microaerophilus]|uniref:Uncharacterized protein n=1 Tax=Caldinitratiruptor microaerophilus TaxID=671077 RepID=A0AA35CLE5_9FIRM|nr:hypothetical protein [Caldinitratiruptor microaerophilus]BDG61469.1 hypothetical protein caldi_25590 [Caldinitratiruptor microaerophilus]
MTEPAVAPEGGAERVNRGHGAERPSVSGRPAGETGREQTLVKRDSPDDIRADREGTPNARRAQPAGGAGADPHPREDH